MTNGQMYKWGDKRSSIRELYEYGKARAAELGADSVFDFSLGNPCVPAPDGVTDALVRLIKETDGVTLHGYTSAQGDYTVRHRVAQNLNDRFGGDFTADNIYMTCGAAAGLAIAMRALCEEGDEIILLAPHFPEYEIFVKAAGGKPVTVKFDVDFQIDFDALGACVTPRTKAVIVNSPNNPSGVVYSRDTICRLAAALKGYEKRFDHPIYVVSDEPYRELVYGSALPTFIPSVYAETIICYSFSKSLSLAGERIGYIAVNPSGTCAQEIYTAILGAGRALGYVCAPSLFQRLIAECLDKAPDISAYAQNKDLLYDALVKMGYECVHPDGAFYLFVKAPDGDAGKMSLKAREYGLLIVPGDDFAAKGWVRVAYCVERATIMRALPAFEDLLKGYGDIARK